MKEVLPRICMRRFRRTAPVTSRVNQMPTEHPALYPTLQASIYRSISRWQLEYFVGRHYVRYYYYGYLWKDLSSVVITSIFDGDHLYIIWLQRQAIPLLSAPFHKDFSQYRLNSTPPFHEDYSHNHL